MEGSPVVFVEADLGVGGAGEDGLGVEGIVT